MQYQAHLSDSHTAGSQVHGGSVIWPSLLADRYNVRLNSSCTGIALKSHQHLIKCACVWVCIWVTACTIWSRAQLNLT